MITTKDIPEVIAELKKLPKFAAAEFINDEGFICRNDMGLIMSGIIFKPGELTMMVPDYEDVVYNPNTDRISLNKLE
jgi:hypothetical protein